ncbi:MAG: hypothetical protein Q7J98_03135, partial [Kiritimatiellia bacterium]|nr:hypothetical protein [Kiritimatiellia bacterium]
MNNINDFHSRIMGVMRSLAALVVLLWFGILVSLADTHYVAQGGQTPAPDYTDWTTAASNIQDAIDIAATVAGDTVLVSNGVYETGGAKVSGYALTNRVAITKAIIVRSANNAPANTIIKGTWASDGSTNGVDSVRCVHMVTNSSLIGFTLTNGATLASGDGADKRGGGISSLLGTTNITISNCVVIGSRAHEYSGGVYANYGVTLYNCTITSNSASGG